MRRYLDQFSLEGKTAIVTGASRGIGAAIAAGLEASGARTIGLSRSPSAPPNVKPIVCDLTDAAAVAVTFEKLALTIDRLDVLVAAAGISLPPSKGREREFERFQKTLAVNLAGAYATVLSALPLLRASGAASIVNVTSINSVRGFPGNPGYVAAKAGLSGLTRALAADLGVDGIRVNAIAPGYVATSMTAKSYSDSVLHGERRRHTLLNRWAEPDDIVGTAIFLASAASAYITGQEIFVDGGWTAKGLIETSSGEKS